MCYEVKIQGRISYVNINASSSSHASELVRVQFGPQVTVLSCKPVHSAGRLPNDSASADRTAECVSSCSRILKSIRPSPPRPTHPGYHPAQDAFRRTLTSNADGSHSHPSSYGPIGSKHVGRIGKERRSFGQYRIKHPQMSLCRKLGHGSLHRQEKSQPIERRQINSRHRLRCDACSRYCSSVFAEHSLAASE